MTSRSEVARLRARTALALATIGDEAECLRQAGEDARRWLIEWCERMGEEERAQPGFVEPPPGTAAEDEALLRVLEARAAALRADAERTHSSPPPFPRGSR